MTVDLRRSPLDGARWGDPAAVEIAEVPFCPAADLRGEARLPLPEAVGHTTVLAGGRRACCIGPDWWLILGLPDDDSLVAYVAAAVTLGSATDVSAQRTRIDVTGPRWADVLRHVWPRDLDALTVDRCAQGLLGRTQALLIREAPDRIAIHVRASFAVYAFALLTDAALEYPPPSLPSSTPIPPPLVALG